MASLAHKVVLINRSALKKTYGAEVDHADRAFTTLIEADADRGLATKLVDVAGLAPRPLSAENFRFELHVANQSPDRRESRSRHRRAARR